MRLLIATSNTGKFAEISEFLSPLPTIEILSLKDLSEEFPEPEENGTTFAENAQIKAAYYFQKTGLPTLAEDSGVEVDALRGELGVKTRRWGAGEKATDEEWMDFFLKRMESESNRSARFFCAACIIIPNHAHQVFEGSSEGIIVQESDVPLQKGIPLSSYFLPLGKEKVFAAMTPEEKNRISHRGKAIHHVVEYLKREIL